MRILRERMRPSAAVLVVMSFATITAHAHEGLETGDYNINIGWIEEPTYEGFKNGVELRLKKAVEEEHGTPSPLRTAPATTGKRATTNQRKRPAKTPRFRRATTTPGWA